MVNVAEHTLDWLFTEQLHIDEQWSYRLPTGFTWWADQHAQTIEIVGEQTGPRGETGYLVCVRTELLCGLDLTDAALVGINAVAMRCAAMSGPVYDVEARRLDLWSLARVHDDNGSWMRNLIAAAATTQIAEARTLAPILAERGAAQPAISGHPQSGMRTVADQMAYAAGVFVISGDLPCAWPEVEFEDATAHLMTGISEVVADGRGLAVEFPFGAQTSDFQVRGDQPHPIYGNGLLLLQHFDVPMGSEAEGVRLALSLNAADLTGEPNGYGFGSYAYADGGLYFSGLISNALHRPGLLANLYSSAAARAQAMSARFVDDGWDAEAYSLDAAVLARRRSEKRARMPTLKPPMRGCPMTSTTNGGE